MMIPVAKNTVGEKANKCDTDVGQFSTLYTCNTAHLNVEYVISAEEEKVNSNNVNIHLNRCTVGELSTQPTQDDMTCLKDEYMISAEVEKVNNKNANVHLSRCTRSMKVKLNEGLPMSCGSNSHSGRPDLYKTYKKLNTNYFNGRCSGFHVRWVYHKSTEFCSLSGKNRILNVNWPKHSALTGNDLEETLLFGMVHILLFKQYQDRLKKEKYEERFLEEIKRINRDWNDRNAVDRVLADKILQNPARAWRK